VGEEQLGASEDELAGLRRGGLNFVGQEAEHGGDVGGDDGGGEELRGEVVEAGDVGVGEGARLEEGESVEDVVDIGGEREVLRFGFGVDYGQSSKVLEVLAVPGLELYVTAGVGSAG